ncbi:MAG: hypothetical protein AAB305_06460 [Candidatus Zixiibacteriota bacterium]
MDENTPPKDAAPVEPIDIPLIEWTCHPAKRLPWVTAVVSIFAVSAVVAVFYTTDSRLFAVLAMLIMWGSLAKFYFPTTYRLSESRITVKTMTQTLNKDWSQYRSCYPDKNGILLSPFAHPSRLENFRGLYLMFEGNRDAVTACIKGRLAQQSQVKEEQS